MSDGVQTLLDVIEDPTVLDRFFNVSDAYPPVQNLDSPGFDNVTAADSSFVSNSLDSLGLESLSDPYRSAGNPILQQAINSSLAVGSGSHQLFSHQFHNDVLQTPHHPGLASPIAGVSHDISRQRDACGHPDPDQTTLQQLLSASNPLTAQQQHVQIQPLHQQSHTTSANVIQGQTNNQSMLMSHHPNRSQQNHIRLPQYMQTLGPESSSLELGHTNEVGGSTSSGRLIQQQQSLGILDIPTNSDPTLLTPAKAMSSGFGKVQIVGGQNQVLPQNIFSPNIAGHVLSGSSLLPGSQVLPSSGQSFAGGNILQGAQILANVMPHAATSGVTSIATQQQPIYVPPPHTTGLSPQPTIAMPSACGTSTLSVLTSASCMTQSTNIVSLGTAKATMAVQPNSAPSSVLSSRPITVASQPSTPRLSSTIHAVQPHTAILSQPGISDGVVHQNFKTTMGTTTRAGISLQQANMTTTTQVSSSVKQQVVSGGQVIHLVGAAPQPRPSIIHPAPKPIQPKPQLLPKPVTSCVVRQPTPPPAGKTLIGSRAITPSNPPPLVIGASPQQAMIGHNPLGSILLNSAGYFNNPNTYTIIPQGNGTNLLVKISQPTANQTILTPVGNSPMINKISQPQSIVLPTSGQTQPLVLPQGITTYPAGSIFGAAQAPRPQQPLIRYMTNPPLQLQQIQTANGPTFIAVPQQQAGLSILAQPQTAVRAISPQVAQAPFQLAPINALPAASLNSLQLPVSGFQTATSQQLQVNAASLISKNTATGLQQTILVNNVPVSAAASKDVPPAKIDKPKKSSKKKKKSVEPKEDTPTTSINLNDILKESGIDNDMMFDESEFGMAIDTSPPAVAAAAPVTVPDQVVSSSVATTSPFCLRPTPSPVANPGPSSVPSIPGMPINMCLTFDLDGKIVLAPQEISKTLGTYMPQPPVQQPLQLQNIQMVPNTVAPAAETILGGVNSRTPLPSQTDQLVKIVNQPEPVAVQPVVKLQSPSQFDLQMNPKEGGDTAVKVPPNRHHDKASRTTNITALPVAISRPNGYEPQTKTDFSKLVVESKSASNQITRSVLSPGRDNNIMPKHSKNEVSNRVAIIPTVTVTNPIKNVVSSINTVDNRNTYQYKYIESVKPPLLTDSVSSKSKKASRKKKKDQDEMVDHQVANRACSLLRKSEDITAKDHLSSPGASMPSISFQSTSMFLPNNVSTASVSGTAAPDSIAISKVPPSSGVMSPPGSYIVSGPGLRLPQNQTQRPRQTCQTIQVMMSQQNQELLKKVGVQMQILNMKPVMTDHDKLMWQKLGAEYNRIISLSKPVSSQTVTAANNVAANSRNSIQYSHAVGHKKILLTPSQKKAMPPAGNMLKEPIRDTFRLEQPFQNRQSSVPSSPAVTMFPSSVTAAVTTSNAVRLSLPDYRVKDNKLEATTAKATNFATPLGFISPTPKDGFGSSPRLPSPLRSAPSSGPSRLAGPQPVVNVEFAPQPPQRQTQSEQPLVTMDKLFLHQMKTDQNGASNPDCKTPFKYRPSAVKRLIRYHVFNEPNANQQEIDEEERIFSAQAEMAVKKQQAMMRKYQSLLIKDSMLRYSSAEQAMLLRLVNQEEKCINEKEKLDGRRGHEINPTFSDVQTIAGSYLDCYPWEDTWPDEFVCVRNSNTHRLQSIDNNQTELTPDRPESEEPILQIFVDEEIDRVTSRSDEDIDHRVTTPQSGNQVDRVTPEFDRQVEANHYRSDIDTPRSEAGDRDTPHSDQSISVIAKRIRQHEFTSTDSDTNSPFLRDADRDTSISRSYGCRDLWIEDSICRIDKPAANGVDMTSSSDSPYDVSPVDNDVELQSDSRRQRKKKNKSRHRDRDKKSGHEKKKRSSRSKRLAQDIIITPEEEAPESPSGGPTKLVLKKTHKGQGYYISSSTDQSKPSTSASSSKRRRLDSESINPSSGYPVSPVRMASPDRGYNLNNYYCMENSNYTYRCS